MEIGLIEWFDTNKGFGMIKTPDENDVFIHISNWKDSTKITSTNKLPILFDLEFHRNKQTAMNCTFFDFQNNQHWEKVFSLNDYSYSIKIDSIKKNLLELIFSNIDSNIDFNLIKSFFIEIIDKLPNERLFNKNLIVFRIYNKTKNILLKKNILELISSRLKRLGNSEIIKFWKEDIISDFFPDQSILINCYNEISISELKKINNPEVNNLIILKKLNNLKQEFNLNEFAEFQEIFSFVDNEKFKIKVSIDLNILANKYYIDFVIEQINELTQRSNIVL